MRSQARPPLLLRSVPRPMSGVPQCPRGATRPGQAPALASNQPPGPGSRWGGARAEPGPWAGPGRSRGGVCAGAGARAGPALGQQRKHRRSAAAEQVSRRGGGAGRAGSSSARTPRGRAATRGPGAGPRTPLTASGRGPFPGAGLPSLRAPVRPCGRRRGGEGSARGSGGGGGRPGPRGWEERGKLPPGLGLRRSVSPPRGPSPLVVGAARPAGGPDI